MTPARQLRRDPKRPAPVEVVRYRGDLSLGTVRQPHRHDYNELFWTREGSGHHLIDGEVVRIEPGTAIVVARGQVHVFAEARGLHGALIRFVDELVGGDGAQRVLRGWSSRVQGGAIAVPPSEIGRLEALVDALAAELALAPDARATDVEHHLLSTILLLLDRWRADAGDERPAADDRDVELHRRFVELLESDYRVHHHAAHYAERLGVPATVLSRRLVAVTGRGTKELISDRVFLEAARLLRFTELTVGEVAHEVGFRDQLYFSRAFKRHAGASPLPYRAASRGRRRP